MLQRRLCSATLTRVSGATPEKGAHFPPPKVMIVGPTSPRRKASLLNSPGLATRRFFWSRHAAVVQTTSTETGRST